MRRQQYTEGQINYEQYKLNFVEYIKYILIISAVASIFSYIFYRNVLSFVTFLIPMNFYFKIIQARLIKKRKQEVTMQFKEFCNSLCAQLMAGYSIENSMKECYAELTQMYGKKACICRELAGIMSKIKLSITVETCFEDFGERSDIEEIKLFAQILKTAKRSGGDVIEIVKNSSATISQKIEVEREIRMIINAKKYEQRIMDVVPLLIVMYVDLTSKDMMNMMYHGILGRIVMTICLMVYIAAFVLGEKLTDVEM